MLCVKILTVSLLFLCCTAYEDPEEPVSQSLLAGLKGVGKLWEAINEVANLPWNKLRSLASGRTEPSPTGNERSFSVHLGLDPIPVNFDASLKWPTCKGIREAQNHGLHCGASWAASAASAISDRICIAIKKLSNFQVSVKDVLNCCKECAYHGDSCKGGNPFKVWEKWMTYGFVGETCRPTPQPSFIPFPPPLRPVPQPKPPPNIPETVINKNVVCGGKCNDYTTPYARSLYKGKSYYVLPNKEQMIQREIAKNGPVQASCKLYDDFYVYRNGVYHHVAGDFVGYHSLKLYGWGLENDAQRTPYWLATNSWGKNFGDNGCVRFLRGSNHLGIEESVVAGLYGEAKKDAKPADNKTNSSGTDTGKKEKPNGKKNDSVTYSSTNVFVLLMVAYGIACLLN